jgi:hypothetical protein
MVVEQLVEVEVDTGVDFYTEDHTLYERHDQVHVHSPKEMESDCRRGYHQLESGNGRMIPFLAFPGMRRWKSLMWNGGLRRLMSQICFAFLVLSCLKRLIGRNKMIWWMLVGSYFGYK